MKNKLQKLWMLIIDKDMLKKNFAIKVRKSNTSIAKL